MTLASQLALERIVVEMDLSLYELGVKSNLVTEGGPNWRVPCS